MRTDAEVEQLRQRRLSTAKGEWAQFFEALMATSDQRVRRTFRGLVASLHAMVFDDEVRR